MDTNKPENPTPAPATQTTAPLPLSHQDHPVWNFLGNFSLALLKFGIAAASADAATYAKDPKIEAPSNWAPLRSEAQFRALRICSREGDY
jgi:hypothetical protein